MSSAASSPNETVPPKARQSIQSVVRASRILGAVSISPQGLTATEIATRFGLPLPTAYHLLATLEDERLLTKEPGKRYVLGSGIADIANTPGLRARADPQHLQALRHLADTTRETAYMTGWFRGEIRILATVEGSQAVRVAGLEVGHTGDVHARASGKVLLAYADDERRSFVLDGHQYNRFTPNTVRDREALELQMAEIRRTGIVFDRGEYRDEVRSISVPIRRNGIVVAAMAVLAPADRYIRTEETLVLALRSAAALAEQGSKLEELS